MTPSANLLASCPVCAHSSANARLRYVKHGLNVFSCDRCRSLFVNPQPTPDDLKAMYSDEQYFQGGGFDGYGYSDYEHMLQFKESTFARWLDDLQQYASPGNLLDIGCATGLMLDIARSAGWLPTGIELSEYAAARARKRGHEVHSDRIENLDLVEGSFDAVVMLDLLEHIPDPVSLLEYARRLIKPGGILYAVTPNVRSVTSRVQRANWPHLKPQEHLCLLSKQGARQLFERAGFDVVALDSARKVISLDHIINELAGTNPVAVGALKVVCGVMPFLRRRELALSLGEMRIVARNPA